MNSVFPSQSRRIERSTVLVSDLDAPVVEEQRQPIPVIERIVDGPGQR